ncbi:MAG: ATP/GTP-binding protein [Coleofasciculus sp. G3-WIS-01]|uniref:GTP-binding protein n=1 Tax=Coleofasciculus sp. G3-WIS-01 TaxID=3069528 RepID=UPI0033002970
METIRLVVTGTVGAGKSTFVRTFSQTTVIDTERKATDSTSLMKKRTTVAFDFGTRTLGRNMELQIYGTPGQSRFDFMWDLLIRRAHAYILLVAANRSSSFNDAREILSFMNSRVQIPMIIGLTCMDLPGALGQEHIAFALGFMNDKNRPPMVALNPNEKTSVFEALMVLMAHQLLQSSKGKEKANLENVAATRKAEPLKSRTNYQWPKQQFSSGL